MKRYIPFLLTISTLLCAAFTGRAQSDSVKVLPVATYQTAASVKVLPVATYQTAASVKVLPVATYGMLVEDAVQLRVMETMVTELTQQISDMEQIQSHIEANLTRQIAILTAENQARETINDSWEKSYGVVKKELGKKQNESKWLKVAVVAAFVLGVMAGK